MRLLIFVIIVAAGIHAEDNSELLPSDCGKFLDFKYFLGSHTEFDDYPWLALLEYDTPRGKLASCGGVLLSSRYVLTAGHCVLNLGANWTLKSVILGEYDTETKIDCLPDGNPENTSTCIPEALSVPIEKKIPHEKYGKSGRAHDIALLRLAEDVKFSEFVKPICLPRKEAQPQKFHVAGWGKLAGRRGSNVKLRSTVSPVNRTTCKEWYAGEKVRLAEDQLCAGGKAKERACLTDSGGPLMGVEKAEDGTVRMTAFAVLTTDSKYCDAEGWPAFYTDVLPYRDWILRSLEK